VSPLVPLTVVIVGLCALFVRARVQATRRRDAMRQWGESRGFSFVAGPCASDDFGFGLACLSLGDQRKARNVLQGRRDGRRVLIFDHSWRSGSGEDARRHERLIAIVEGKAWPQAAAARATDLAGIVSDGFETNGEGFVLRADVTVRVVRGGDASKTTTYHKTFASSMRPDGPRIECGANAVAVVAAKGTPASELDGLLGLAESTFVAPSDSERDEPAPVREATDVAR